MDIPELLIRLEEKVKDSYKRKASKKQPTCFQKGGSGHISPAEHRPGGQSLAEVGRSGGS